MAPFNLKAQGDNLCC